MSKPFYIGFAVMAVVIAAGIWTGFVKTKGNHLAPTGSIGKVRTLKISDDLTFMVLDFNIKNDSDVDMVVRTVECTVDAADGSTITGNAIAASDAVDAFRNYPLLGELYNAPLKERDKVPAHQAVDRMVGIRLDATDEKVEARKRVTLRIEDITGAEVVLTK